MAFIQVDDIDFGSCNINVDNITYICNGIVSRDGVDVPCTKIFQVCGACNNCTNSKSECISLIQSCGVICVSTPNPTPTPTPTGSPGF